MCSQNAGLTPSAIAYYPGAGEGKKNGPLGSFAPPLKNPYKMHCFAAIRLKWKTEKDREIKMSISEEVI
jgi:hypothetical protein